MIIFKKHKKMNRVCKIGLFILCLGLVKVKSESLSLFCPPDWKMKDIIIFRHYNHSSTRMNEFVVCLLCDKFSPIEAVAENVLVCLENNKNTNADETQWYMDPICKTSIVNAQDLSICNSMYNILPSVGLQLELEIEDDTTIFIQNANLLTEPEQSLRKSKTDHFPSGTNADLFCPKGSFLSELNARGLKLRNSSESFNGIGCTKNITNTTLNIFMSMPVVLKMNLSQGGTTNDNRMAKFFSGLDKCSILDEKCFNSNETSEFCGIMSNKTITNASRKRFQYQESMILCQDLAHNDPRHLKLYYLIAATALLAVSTTILLMIVIVSRCKMSTMSKDLYILKTRTTKNVLRNRRSANVHIYESVRETMFDPGLIEPQVSVEDVKDEEATIEGQSEESDSLQSSACDGFIHTDV